MHRVIHRRRIEDGPMHRLSMGVGEAFGRRKRAAVDRFEVVDEIRIAVLVFDRRVEPEDEDVIERGLVRSLDDDRAREFGVVKDAVLADAFALVAAVVAERARPIEHERDTHALHPRRYPQN